MEYAGMSVAIGRAVVAPLVAMIGVVVVVWMGRRTNWIESQLRQQSFTDQLTGLLNQRGFEDATLSLGRRAAATDGGVIAFFFDLDNLKRANDLLGHTAGSQVIQRFADLLAVTFRKSDVIGRVGGDEFVVLAPAPAETADDMLRRFARVVETLNATEYMPVPISYSVGYAELEAGDAGDLAGLIAEADARMYAQKSRKRAA
jgi:diguanylate cyclase (GGDEF)-like protein